MIELLREWIMGIVIISILSAIAVALAGESPSVRIIRMISAAGLLLATVWPLKRFNTDDFLRELYSYGSGYTVAARDAVAAAGQMTCDITAQSLERYIKSLAGERGIECDVKISAVYADGIAVPVKCVLKCAEYGGKLSDFTATVARELGIREGDVVIEADG